jgi:hypothetical protein
VQEGSPLVYWRGTYSSLPPASTEASERPPAEYVLVRGAVERTPGVAVGLDWLLSERD